MLKRDVGTAKNYLDAKEIDTLNRITVMFLDQAEFRAQRRQDNGLSGARAAFSAENAQLRQRLLLCTAGCDNRIFMPYQAVAAGIAGSWNRAIATPWNQKIVEMPCPPVLYQTRQSEVFPIEEMARGYVQHDCVQVKNGFY